MNVSFLLTSSDRLLQVDSGSDSEAYSYAADGLRRKKVVGGVTTHFIWDEQNPLMEQQ